MKKWGIFGVFLLTTIGLVSSVFSSTVSAANSTTNRYLGTSSITAPENEKITKEQAENECKKIRGSFSEITDSSKAQYKKYYCQISTKDDKASCEAKGINYTYNAKYDSGSANALTDESKCELLFNLSEVTGESTNKEINALCAKSSNKTKCVNDTKENRNKKRVKNWIDGGSAGITAKSTDEAINAMCDKYAGGQASECKEKAIAAREEIAGGPVCLITGGLSFILCPIANIAGSAADKFAEYIDEQLSKGNELLTNNFGQDNDKGAWGIATTKIQPIANVLLAIAFLFIIISTAMGSVNIGDKSPMSNLNVKRMFPKFVIAAILVNLSVPFCMFLTDLSTIIGESIGNIVSGMFTAGMAGTEMTAGQRVGQVFLNVWGFIEGAKIVGGVAAITAILAGPSMVGVLAMAVVLIAIPVALGLLVILLFLQIRILILMLCVILAPIAIALMILPNTKKLFDQWLDIFVKMLLIYPAFVLICKLCDVLASLINGGMIE
jgi:hypothetical protein